MSFLDQEEIPKSKGPDVNFRISMEEAQRNFRHAADFKKNKMPLPEGVKIDFDKDKGDWVLSMIWMSYRNPNFPSSSSKGVDRGVSLNQFYSSFSSELQYSYEVILRRCSGKLPEPTLDVKEEFPCGKPIQGLLNDMMIKMKYGE